MPKKPVRQLDDRVIYRAAARLRRQAREAGTSKMSLKEINALIEATRAERRRRR